MTVTMEHVTRSVDELLMHHRHRTPLRVEAGDIIAVGQHAT
jgi:hypothetical protein